MNRSRIDFVDDVVELMNFILRPLDFLLSVFVVLLLEAVPR